MGRTGYLLSQKEAGRSVAAVWPARYPEELLWAHNLVPAEMWDPPADIDRADAHIQSYACGVVRRGLEFLMGDGASVADLLLFPHTCDSIQNMGSVVKDLLREGRPCLTFYPPKWNSDDTAKDYLSGQIEDLSEELRRMGLPMAEGALEEALSWGARRTALLNELYGLRASGSLAAGNAAFYQAVRSREYLWPEDASKRLGEFILEKRGRRADGATPLVFSGILPQPRDLMAQLDDLGVAVVEDDFLCCGRRFVRGEPPVFDDPWQTLAARLFALPPCSTTGSPIQNRLRFVENLVERSSARGVVFLTLKFCEPELFEVPSLSLALREKGIPVLVLESEIGDRTSAGLMTRLEAFLEALP